MEVLYQGLKFKLFEEHLKHTQNMPLKDRFINQVWEKEEIDAIKKFVKPTDNVLDLGGSLGVTSCIAANIIKNQGKLVSVEANPNLIPTIKYNRDLNNLIFDVIHGAASYNNRKVNFNFNQIVQSGSIITKNHLKGEDKEKKWGKYENIELTTITPIDLEKQFNIKFTCLSCDIEGEEYSLLGEMFDYFKSFNSLLIEFHPHINPKDFKKYDNKIIKMYSPYFNITNQGNTKHFIKK